MICTSERESESWREIYAYTLYHILPKEVQKKEENSFFDPLLPLPPLCFISSSSSNSSRTPPYTKIHTPKKRKKKKKKPTPPPFLTSSLLSKVDNRFHISTPIHLRQLDQQFGFIPQCKHFTTLNPILTLGIQF